MAKIEKVAYKCDICGKEVDNEKALAKVVLPLPYYAASDWQMGHNKTDSLSAFKGDACKKCRKKIARGIEKMCKRYGEFAYVGKIIEWK